MQDRRVFIKLSGESLRAPGGQYPIDGVIVQQFVDELVELLGLGYELSVTIGGGNIFRGRDAFDIRSGTISTDSADKMGLMATVINGIAVRDVLAATLRERAQRRTIRLFSDHAAFPLAEPFNDFRDNIDFAFEDGDVFIFSGIGTSGLGVTSDTVAVERAIKTRSSIIVKGTKFPGVYDRDPALDPQALLLPEVTASEVLEKEYRVMDLGALRQARDAGIRIAVTQCVDGTFENLRRVIVNREAVGTWIEPA